MDESIKILIVDDQKSVRHYIQNLIENNRESIQSVFNKNIEIVGLVSKGSEVIRTIEDLNPHILILDLVMPDQNGYEIISEMQELERIESKILIVSGEKYSEKINLLVNNIPQVYGYVNKSRLEKDLIAAIVSVDLNNLFVSKEKNQGCSINLLDIWKYVIAEKLIVQWRYANEMTSPPIRMLEALQADMIKINFEDNRLSEVLQNLSDAIAEIEKAYFKREDFNSLSFFKAREVIRKWLTNKIFVRIDKSAKESRIDKICRFKKLIDLDWHQASPCQLMEYLEFISENLQITIDNYESQRNSCLEKSNRAEQAFNNLKMKFEKVKSFEKKKQLWKSAMNTLVVLNEQILVAHLCSAEISVLKGLISSVESYYDHATQADRLLLETQVSLNKWLEPVLDRIDVKSELESFMEQKLIEWGASPSVSSNLILDQLLSSINLANINEELEGKNQTRPAFSFINEINLDKQNN